MLARKNRISRKEFPSFRDKGARFLSPLFSGSVFPSSSSTRVSVVVSKKTAKNATDRNRIRRLFYAAVEPFLANFTHTALVIFYPKVDALKAPSLMIRSEIEVSLRKIKILP